MIAQYLFELWRLLEESSFYLLLGLLVGGLLKVFLPEKLIERHLREPGIRSTLKASAIGVPLPLCSCSVVPVACSLRRQGASSGATASFLISTPEIGVDSFLLSWGLLGLPFSLLRLVAAFVSAATIGLAIDRFASEPPPSTSSESSCCGSCCDPPARITLHSRLVAALRFGFVDLVEDIAPSLILGLACAALLSLAIPEGFFLRTDVSPFALMLLMLGFALPLYVCASASTPLAATLLMKGMPPGPVLVFLLAGPASNVATMLVVRKELGARALAIYLVGLTLVTLAFAGLADVVLPSIADEPLHATHHLESDATAIVLSALLLFGSVRALRKKFAKG